MLIRKSKMLLVYFAIVAVAILIPTAYILGSGSAYDSHTVNDGYTSYKWTGSNFSSNKPINATLISIYSNATFFENNRSVSDMSFKLSGGEYYFLGSWMINIFWKVTGNITGNLQPTTLYLYPHGVNIPVDNGTWNPYAPYVFDVGDLWNGMTNTTPTDWGYHAGRFSFQNLTNVTGSSYYFSAGMTTQYQCKAMNDSTPYLIDFMATINGLSQPVICQINLTIEDVLS